GPGQSPGILLLLLFLLLILKIAKAGFCFGFLSMRRRRSGGLLVVCGCHLEWGSVFIMPVRLFISYASKDGHWRDRILTAMSALVRSEWVVPWHDRKIEGGDEWEAKIFEQIASADVALLLISENFLASDFINDKEIPALRRRFGSEKKRIIPILVDFCFYETMEFLHGLQLLNAEKVPITKSRPQTRAISGIVSRLHDRLKTDFSNLINSKEKSPTPAPADPPLSLSLLLQALPTTSPRLFGREKELAMLDEVRQNKGVLVWVAGGGTGKSALVRHWLQNVEWSEGSRFLGHSFYSQGSKEQHTSSANFLRDALLQLGCKEKEIPADNYEQGELLAKRVREKPTVLVLDGVEPLQHPPDERTKLGGQFKDNGLFALLTELVREPGMAICLVSSRLHLSDTGLEERADHHIRQCNLEHLPPVAAVELLKDRGVHGPDEDLAKAAARYNHHALALVLLSEYLHTFHQGRVEHALEIPLIAKETKAGRHAMSVMRAYDVALKKAKEPLDREMVRLLGLFDRPAEWAALDALRKADPIPGLTALFKGATEEQVNESLARLRQWGLLNPGGRDAALDAHPLVREWFGEAFQKESPDHFRQAHRVLFHHYQQVPEKVFPDTLEEMEPLYRAVRHGCLAGEYQEALNKVYWDRIRRGDKVYSLHVLGAHASDLAALAGFFPQGLNNKPAVGLMAAAQNWAVADAAFLLMSLGRMGEAAQVLIVGMQMYEQAENWLGAAISAENLVDILLPLGQLAEAETVATQGLVWAEKVAWKEKNLEERRDATAYQGRVAYAQGQMEAAARAFQRAEALQKELEPDFPQLYSLSGTEYALFLLERADGRGDREAVREHGRYIGRESRRHLPQEVAFSNLVIGLARESLGEGRAAESHLQVAVAKMQKAGKKDFLPWLLLAHAGVLHRLRKLPQAKKQLHQAREIAARGEMRLYLAECHLLEGLIALDEGQLEVAERACREAKKSIEEMGYARIKGELLWLEGKLHNDNTRLQQAEAQFLRMEQRLLLERYFGHS
ncbi:MAG: TIR domain-containing protein, partial [Magnetococcus sp. XQGC-1]